MVALRQMLVPMERHLHLRESLQQAVVVGTTTLLDELVVLVAVAVVPVVRRVTVLVPLFHPRRATRAVRATTAGSVLEAVAVLVPLAAMALEIHLAQEATVFRRQSLAVQQLVVVVVVELTERLAVLAAEALEVIIPTAVLAQIILAAAVVAPKATQIAQVGTAAQAWSLFVT